MSNEAKAVACRVAKSDWEAEEIVAAVDSELAPLLARVERLEQALRAAIHQLPLEAQTHIRSGIPRHKKFADQYLLDITTIRAALNDEEVTQPDFQGNDYFHACDFNHDPVCIICGEPSKEANDG